MKYKNAGLFAILSAAAMWGTIGIFSRGLHKVGFSMTSLVFYRALITALVMFVVILIKKPALLKIRLRDIWIFLGSGILSFFFFNVCYMLSIGVNSLAVACILMYTSPVFVMLFSIAFFHERFSCKKGIALLIAVGGCALVSLTGEVHLTLMGFLLGIGSGIGYALYSIFGTIALKKDYSTLTITFYTFLFAAVAGLLTADFSVTLPILAQNPQRLVQMVLFVLWVTVFPYLLYTWGMGKTGPTVASIVATVEPVVAALCGLYFAETVNVWGIIGICAVIGSIVLLNLPGRKEKAEKRS